MLKRFRVFLRRSSSDYTLFEAMKEKINEGYTISDLKSDILAGIIVALVAIPLGMSLAIAVGVAPQIGLYTAIVTGFITALAGGSRFQITGPTAAFVAILLPIVSEYGYEGLVFTSFFAGIILVIMGYVHFGKIIQFIPFPVTTGFTSGIGFIIMTLQIKDFFGLKISNVPGDFLERMKTFYEHFGTFSKTQTIVGIVTLVGLVCWRKAKLKIPAPVVILPLVSLICFIYTQIFPEIQIATIMTKFSSTIQGSVCHGIPKVLPAFYNPLHALNKEGETFLHLLTNIKVFLLPAFIVAILAAIESLLSAVIADGMTHTKHNPDSELIGLGLGNIIGSFWGSIPATGAIARTATNIRFGGKSPVAAVIHSITILAAILFAAPVISYLPIASLAALLILVSYDMIAAKRFLHILKISPKSDALVLLTCFSLTVLFDMVMGVSVGIVLAALLFMRRMTEVTHGDIISPEKYNKNYKLDNDNIMLYRIDGPMFFGAADKAVQLITDVVSEVKAVILIMDSVPSIDVTALIALENAIKQLKDNNKIVILAEIQKQPRKILRKAGWINSDKGLLCFKSVEEAIDYAKSKLSLKTLEINVAIA